MPQREAHAVPQPEARAREVAIPEGFGDMFVFIVLIYFCIKWLSESEFRYDFL